MLEEEHAWVSCLLGRRRLTLSSRSSRTQFYGVTASTSNSHRNFSELFLYVAWYQNPGRCNLHSLQGQCIGYLGLVPGTPPRPHIFILYSLFCPPKMRPAPTKSGGHNSAFSTYSVISFEIFTIGKRNRRAIICSSYL